MRAAGTTYIMASQPRGTLYIGVTSNFLARIHQHRHGTFDGFTKRYTIRLLVWYDHHRDIAEAIAHEKRLKNWRRAWKVALVEEQNLRWDDLALGLGFERLTQP